MLVQLRRSILDWIRVSRPVPPSESRTGLAWLLIPAALLLGAFTLLRMTYPGSAEKDDCDLILFSQRLSWGYSDMSPLYTWLAHLAIQTFGVSVAALTVVRVVVLVAIYFLLYANARELGLEPRLAALATHAFLLIPALAWNSLTYLTHTNALIAASLLVLLTFLRLARTGQTRDYVLFGVACGIAGLSKYNAAWFVAALGAAGLTIGPVRQRLLDRRLLISIGIAGVMILPHCLWLVDQWKTIAAGLQEKATRPDTVGQSYLVRVLLGMKETLLLVVVLAAPAAAAVAICFRGALRPAPATPAEPGTTRLLIGRLLAFGVIVVLLQVAAVGASKVHERWVIHFAAVIPLWLFCRLNASAIRPAAIRGFAALLVVFAVGYTAARAVQVGSPAGMGQGWHPVKTSEDELARAIAAEAGESPTIVSCEPTVAGNLRLRLPNARVIYSGYRNFAGPEAEGTMVLVWNRAYGPQPPWPFFHLVEHVVAPRPVPPEAVRSVPIAPATPERDAVVMCFAIIPR